MLRDALLESVDFTWLARRALLYLAAPGAMALVVLIGMTLSSTSHLPRGVTSTVGPTYRAIGEPVGLEIPSLHAKAPITRIGLRGDVLISPRDVRTVGWWHESAQPGSHTGQSLLSGHTYRAGYSPMNHLKDINPGATILIHGKKRTASFLVQDVFIWSKKKIAKHSVDLFDPDLHDSRMVLVTSAGYDGKKWNSNVIVFGYPN
jgi:sortase (surface protein transpeptidase)